MSLINLFLSGPLLTFAWRSRGYLADATAVDLTRDPDGLARGSGRLGEGGRGVPGTAWLELLLVVGGSVGAVVGRSPCRGYPIPAWRRRSRRRSTKRLARLRAMGASSVPPSAPSGLRERTRGAQPPADRAPADRHHPAHRPARRPAGGRGRADRLPRRVRGVRRAGDRGRAAPRAPARPGGPLTCAPRRADDDAMEPASPLARKLKLKPGLRAAVIGAPAGYLESLDPPAGRDDDRGARRAARLGPGLRPDLGRSGRDRRAAPRRALADGPGLDLATRRAPRRSRRT